MPNNPFIFANISDTLLGRMPDNASIIDRFEVGRWLSIEQISEYRRKFPNLSFLFHGSNMIAEVGEGTGVEQRIQEYLSATGSTWFSVHLMIWQAERWKG